MIGKIVKPYCWKYRFLYFTYPSFRIKLWTRSFFDSMSYYPEMSSQRKSQIRICIEQLINLLRHGSFDDFYFLYGFDIKGLRNKKEYVYYDDFFVRRDYMNFHRGIQYVGILRDKLMFYCFAAAMNVPTPRVVGTIEKGVLSELFNGNSSSPFDYIVRHQFDGFIKAISGECGNGVYAVRAKDNESILVDDDVLTREGFMQLIENGKFIVQERITNQHPKLSALHQQSVNTIRLVTVMKDGKCSFLPPLLRVGAGHNKVDNWAKGGLAIGIDVATCTLNEYGYLKPQYGCKTDRHPDTGIIFKGYQLPYLEESIRLAMSLHEKLPKIHSIGWDLAITENGPIIIEGNDNWEISLHQACSHGWYKEFKELFY